MSAMTVAVRAVELTKQYDIYRRPIDRADRDPSRAGRATPSFPALQDVTFEVERGETDRHHRPERRRQEHAAQAPLRRHAPTSGIARDEGHASPRSSSSAPAFIPSSPAATTPRSTPRSSASTAAEVKQRLPAILEFSELGTFLDRPVKTYSSGMYMRLAFSVAVNVDPDILVIDEALAVGDGHFQKKCVDKIREFQEEGKTILFCSHALYYVTTICRRTLWLDHGRVMRYGPSLDVVHEYETFLLQRDRERPASEGEPEHERPPSPVRIREIVVCDRSGRPRDRFDRGEDIHVKLRIHSEIASQPVHVIVGVHRSRRRSAVLRRRHACGRLRAALRTQRVRARRRSCTTCRCMRGEYSIIAFVGDENAITVFDRRDVRPGFSITGERFEVGLISLDHHWSLAPAEADAAQPAGAMTPFRCW